MISRDTPIENPRPPDVRILHTVEFYSPSVGGMQEVVRQLSERLVCMGHDVTVATKKLRGKERRSVNGVKIAEFDIKGNLVRGLSGEVDRYRAFLANEPFDLVTNFAAQQWATDVALTMLEEIRARKVFVPTGFSALYAPEYASYFEAMKQWMRNYDANIFLSNNYRDIDFARQNGITRIAVIPNGAGADEFGTKRALDIRAALRIPRDYLVVLHVGSHTGVKGHREAIEIFRKARIRRAALLIVANTLKGGCGRSCWLSERMFRLSLQMRRDDKRLAVHSLSRSETIAAYQQADIFLFPSNIECSPLVLFESMAAGIPFLTTDVGNAREIIEWSNAGRVLPTYKDALGYSYADTDESARMLEELAGNRTLRDSLARCGSRAWSERFTWERIAAQYESLYQEILKGGNGWSSRS